MLREERLSFPTIGRMFGRDHTTVVDGVRTVVTHMSKKTRGEITRWLLQSRSMPKTPEDLYAIVSEKYPCALTPSDGQQPWVLEVIAV
jgi:cytoplasmic iron level regulating protein YaaA (DUF328/UPF0246 family)